MGALPVITHPDTTEPDDHRIELWGDDAIYDAEESKYVLTRLMLEPDNTVSFIGDPLINQDR